MSGIRRWACGALAAAMALGLLPGLPVRAGAVALEGSVPVITVNETLVAFGGYEWYVVGYSGGATPAGVYTAPASSATLLAKNDEFGAMAFRMGSANPVAGYTQDGSNARYYIDNPNAPPNWVQPNDYLYSTLQLELADIAAGIPPQERALINPRTLASADQIAGVEVVGQLLWPLSHDEWTAVDDTELLSFGGYPGDDWWLRSPATSAHQTWVSNMDGQDYRHVDAMDDDISIRPALSLDLSSLVLTTAVDGKPASAGPSLAPVTALGTADRRKFTLVDPGLTLQLGEATKEGDTLALPYRITGTAPCNALSAMVTDAGGTVKYYGRLLDSPARDTEGVARLTLPADLADTDSLYVFAEQINSGLHTDFASQPQPLTLPAPAPVQADPGSSPPDAPVPTPGDGGAPALWFALAAGSLGAIGLLLRRRRRV